MMTNRIVIAMMVVVEWGDVKDDNVEDHSAVSSIYDYSRKVLSLGLFYLYFKDSVREGDGTRVMLGMEVFYAHI